MVQGLTGLLVNTRPLDDSSDRRQLHHRAERTRLTRSRDTTPLEQAPHIISDEFLVVPREIADGVLSSDLPRHQGVRFDLIHRFFLRLGHVLFPHVSSIPCFEVFCIELFAKILIGKIFQSKFVTPLFAVLNNLSTRTGNLECNLPVLIT